MNQKMTDAGITGVQDQGKLLALIGPNVSVQNVIDAWKTMGSVDATLAAFKVHAMLDAARAVASATPSIQ